MNDDPVVRAHRRRNALQSLALLVGMTALLALLGWSIAGLAGIAWIAGTGLALLAFGVGMSGQLLLRLYRARPLQPAEAPQLYAILAEIAERARLRDMPRLFYVPSRMLQAFTVALPGGSSAIAMTDGLLRGLSVSEIAAVLAHESSHVHNRDLRLMTLADMVTKLTRAIAFFGLLLAFVNLPLLMLGKVTFPWLAVLLMLIAPGAVVLMQQALSRTREFDADLGAVTITGDPDALASALMRLEAYQRPIWEQLLLPGYRMPDPSLLRTHPRTEDRIARITALPRGRPLESISRPARMAPRAPRPVRTIPRWRRTGLWY